MAVKLEMLNPGGSVKDRPALAMIDQAERGPAAARRHHRRAHVGQHRRRPRHRGGHDDCIFVVTDKVAPEKIRLLEAYGAA